MLAKLKKRAPDLIKIDLRFRVRQVGSSLRATNWKSGSGSVAHETPCFYAMGALLGRYSVNWVHRFGHKVSR